MATVFVFTGRAYYGRPGIDWQMAEVQEDYAARRPFKGGWAKAQSWLVAHGYRRLWATPVERDGCDVTQVWGLVRVFGDINVTYTGAYAVQAAFRHWQEAQGGHPADVRFERAYGWHTIYWFVDRGTVDARGVLHTARRVPMDDEPAEFPCGEFDDACGSAQAQVWRALARAGGLGAGSRLGTSEPC